MAAIRTVVIAHESRGDRGRLLAEKVGGVLYPDSGDGSPDALWEAHARAFRAELGNEGWTHLCVLQDDALPIEEFQTHLGRVVEARPDGVISLYLGKGAPKGVLQTRFEAAVARAKQEDYSWATSTSYHCYHGVGLVLPRRVVEAAVTRRRPGMAAYDQWIGMVSGGLKVPVLYTLPSLVDHDAEETPVRGRGTEGRVAHWVGVPTLRSNKAVVI